MNNANLQSALNAFQTSLTNKLGAKVAEAINADNALLISGKTAESMVADQAAVVTAHVNRKDNPHGTTASQVGAHTKAEVASLVSGLVPLDKLPISFFGDNTETPINSTYNALTFNIIGSTPVLLAGKYTVMPDYQLTVLPNKTTYIFARLVNGVPTLVVEAKDPTDTAITPDSLTNMLVAVIRANTAIYHVSAYKRRRVGVTSVPVAPPTDRRYRVISTGLTDVSWGEGKTGLWWKDEHVNMSSRGLNVVCFINGRIVRSQIFDTCGDAAANDAFIAFINAIPTGWPVLIYVFDEAANMLNLSAMNAMGSIGVQPTNVRDELKYRSAMVILGRKGDAQGSARIAISGDVSSSADASVSITFDVNDASGFHNITTEKYGHFSRNL